MLEIIAEQSVTSSVTRLIDEHAACLIRIAELETDVLRLRCLLAEGNAYAKANRPLDNWIRSASAYLQSLCKA